MRISFLFSIPFLAACVSDPPSMGDSGPGNDSPASVDSGGDTGVADDAADASPPNPAWTYALTSRTTIGAIVVEPTTGDVFFGGYVTGAAPELGIATTSGGSQDMLIGRLEGGTGKLLWAKSYGGTGDEQVTALALAGGALIAIGATYGDTMSFPGSATGSMLTFPKSTTMPVQLATQTFIARFDSNSGAPQWAMTPDANETANTSHHSQCTALAVGTLVYAACRYQGSKFGPVNGYAPAANNLIGQGVVLTINSLGSLLPNTRAISSSGNIGAVMTSLVDKGGVLYAVGVTGIDLTDKNTTMTVTAPNTTSNGFVMSFPESPQGASVLKLLSPNTTVNDNVSVYSVNVLANSIIVGGRYGGTPAFGSLPIAMGSSDVFIAGLPLNLSSVAFAKRFGGTNEDDLYSMTFDGTSLWVGVRYFAAFTFGTTMAPAPVQSGWAGLFGKLSNVGVPDHGIALVPTGGSAVVGAVQSDDLHGYVLGAGSYNGSLIFDDGKMVSSASDSAGFVMRRPR